jgi:hypothetical protein
METTTVYQHATDTSIFWTWRTVKVGVPKKVVFSKISAHVSESNKSIS